MCVGQLWLHAHQKLHAAFNTYVQSWAFLTKDVRTPLLWFFFAFVVLSKKNSEEKQS